MFYRNLSHAHALINVIVGIMIITYSITYRQIAAVERMDDERFVANVDDAADAVARVEGRTGARIVLDGAVVVAVLDVLCAFLCRQIPGISWMELFHVKVFPPHLYRT